MASRTFRWHSPRNRPGVWLWRLAVPLIALGLWQLAWRLGLGSRALLPSPGAVWTAGASLHDSGTMRVPTAIRFQALIVASSMTS